MVSSKSDGDMWVTGCAVHPQPKAVGATEGHGYGLAGNYVVADKILRSGYCGRIA
jgi:hypothetical protein